MKRSAILFFMIALLLSGICSSPGAETPDWWT